MANKRTARVLLSRRKVDEDFGSFRTARTFNFQPQGVSSKPPASRRSNAETSNQHGYGWLSIVITEICKGA